MKKLRSREGLFTDFDVELWNAIIEKVIVNIDDEIEFVLKDGMELEWNK